MSTVETAAALDVASSKLQAARDRIAELQEQERALSDAVGEQIADAKDPATLKAQREDVREELDDLLYAEKALAGKADMARRQHEDATQAAHVAKLQSLAETLRTCGASYERALVTLKRDRAAFIAAGRALAQAAKASGDQFSSRFDVERLADDLVTARVWDKGHPAYAGPVSDLVEPILTHLDRI